jgi:fermentation-respiration switch protein FrsA (DUF1100 family)
MAKLIFLYLLFFVVGMMALKLLVVLLEPRLTFFPIRGLDTAPEKSGLPIKEIPLQTADEETVYAWLLEHPEPRGEVLFFHGNGGNLSIWQDFLMSLYHNSLTVFALDYRGYGKSTGSPTEEGLYKDAEALLRHFWTKIHRPDHKVIYWGQSLGGSVAAFATTVRKPDGVILESSFPNKYSLLNHHPALKVLGFLSEFKFPTAEFLDGISCPVLVLHGEQDKVVPLKQGQLLFDRLQTEKYFHTMPAGHNDLHQVNPDKYWEHINQLIDAMGDGQDSH